MRLCLNTPLKVFLLLFLCAPVFGQTPVARESAGPTHRVEIDDDPKYILEVGAATSWTTTGGSATFAPNLAAETTPIDTGWSLKPEFPLSSLATLRSGTRICCSRSPGLFRLKQSSCLA
jgi:hypothetical protein